MSSHKFDVAAPESPERVEVVCGRCHQSVTGTYCGLPKCARCSLLERVRLGVPLAFALSPWLAWLRSWRAPILPPSLDAMPQTLSADQAMALYRDEKRKAIKRGASVLMDNELAMYFERVTARAA